MGKTAHQAITGNVIVQTSDLSIRRRHGRAVNAVADYLRSQLRVPNIYIDPSGALLSKVDVLAVDAAGSGDIHAVNVELLTGPKTMSLKVIVAKTLPALLAHYRYFAIPKNATNILVGLDLFSDDGIGRVGILLISESEDQLPIVELAIKPERFRLAANGLTQVERFLNRAKPDMYVRL